MRKTIFDELENILDDTELEVPDQVIFSKEMADLIREEIRKEIANMPIGKIVSKVVSKEANRIGKQSEDVKSRISKEITDLKSESKNDLSKIKKEIEEALEKFRKKYDDLKNDIMTINGKQWYQFGGFSPQFNDLNIGDPGTEGSWRIVIQGNELVVQRLESNVWVTKGSFVP